MTAHHRRAARSPLLLRPGFGVRGRPGAEDEDTIEAEDHARDRCERLDETCRQGRGSPFGAQIGSERARYRLRADSISGERSPGSPRSRGIESAAPKDSGVTGSEPVVPGYEEKPTSSIRSPRFAPSTLYAAHTTGPEHGKKEPPPSSVVGRGCLPMRHGNNYTFRPRQTGLVVPLSWSRSSTLGRGLDFFDLLIIKNKGHQLRQTSTKQGRQAEALTASIAESDDFTAPPAWDQSRRHEHVGEGSRSGTRPAPSSGPGSRSIKISPFSSHARSTDEDSRIFDPIGPAAISASQALFFTLRGLWPSSRGRLGRQQFMTTPSSARDDADYASASFGADAQRPARNRRSCRPSTSSTGSPPRGAVKL